MRSRRASWILLLAAGLAAGVAASRWFTQVFPIVSLDLRMDRAQALARARALADARGWGPGGAYRQAATFGVDDSLQTYVELELGGKAAFARLLDGAVVAPYTWRVRHFREGETRETWVTFTAAGEPWGFLETLPEAEPGPALGAVQAKALADSLAAADWGVDLARWRLAEQAQETRPGGRVDHTITYERPDTTIGAAPVRLRLRVSGDRFSELSRTVPVPEAFARRYAEMRSANDGIATASSFAILLLYGVAGCGVGTFVLLRRRAFDWRPAFRFALFIAGLGAAAAVSQFPLLWLGYDTAKPVGGWLAEQALGGVALLVGNVLMLALSFAVAEGLTRLAFGAHPRLWHAWSREAAPTPALLGRTLAGYALVGVFLLYQVGLAWVSQREWGWWNPSDTLVSPDAVAGWAPWLPPVALAAQAGFWEECLFRAVPLAGAALIGDRLGHRRAWIAVAFVLQAVIFAAGHANYPAQPAWARVVELILPSFAFGGLYLAYGLVPAAVMHYVYDAVLMAIPVWVSRAPGIWASQFLAATCIAVPLLVVLYHRLRAGAWQELPDRLRNAGWVAAPPVPSVAVAGAATAGEPGPVVVPAVAPGAAPAWMTRTAVGLGAAGLAVAVAAALGAFPAPAVRLDRAGAIAVARRELEARGVRPGPEWRWLARVDATTGEATSFVWRTAGPARYADVLGRDIRGPGWEVRVVSFDGDVAERAEEWRVSLTATGAVWRYEHRLPEAREGPLLDEAAAREVAHRALRIEYDLDARQLVEVSAAPQKRPARTDWSFTFRDTTAPVLPEGERRIQVGVAGGELADIFRFVFVPEAWQRAQRAEAPLRTALGALALILPFAVFGTSVVSAVVAWSRGLFARRLALRLAAALFVLGALRLANDFPSLEAGFTTAQPYRLQAAIGVAGLGIGALLLAALGGLSGGMAATWLAAAGAGRGPRLPLAAGIGAGLALAGTRGAAALVSRARGPDFPSVAALDTAVPVLGSAVATLLAWVLTTVALLAFAGYLVHFTAGWTRRQGGALLLVALAGASFAGTPGASLLGGWLLSGAIGALVAIALLRGVFTRDPATIPVATATAALAGLLQVLLARAWPGAALGAALGGTLVVLAAGWAARAIGTADVEAPPPEPPPPGEAPAMPLPAA